MKKRIVATLLMFCVAFSLVACGGNGTGNDTQKDNTENSQQDDANVDNDSEKEEDTNVDDGKIEYTVKLVDANGAPVANTMVQVCNSETCFAPKATDANGVAVFSLEESNEYKAKLMTAGEDAYVYFENGSTEVTITMAE